MEKCWASYWEIQQESNLVLMKDQGCFYQVDTLRVLGLVTLRVKVLDRVILWVIKKELGLEIKWMKSRVPHLEFHTEENLGLRKEQIWYIQISLLRGCNW